FRLERSAGRRGHPSLGAVGHALALVRERSSIRPHECIATALTGLRVGGVHARRQRSPPAGCYSGSNPSRYRTGWGAGKRAYATAESSVSSSELPPYRLAAGSAT